MSIPCGALYLILYPAIWGNGLAHRLCGCGARKGRLYQNARAAPRNARAGGVVWLHVWLDKRPKYLRPHALQHLKGNFRVRDNRVAKYRTKIVVPSLSESP